EGNPQYLACIATDITERKQAEAELLQYRKHLEELVLVRTTELRQANEQFQQEIAERVRVEKTLRESEDMLRLVFDNVFDGISIYEEFPDLGTRRLIDCNARYAEISGRSKQELLEFGNTLSIQRLIRHEVKKEGFPEIPQAGGAYQGLFSWLRPDGKENIVEYAAVTVRMGERILTIGVDRDITAHKRAEEALKKYSEQLEEMVEERTKELQEAQERLIRQEKLAFLGQLAGGVGHELRNPLGVITNAVYFLQLVLPEADETIKEYLAIIASRVYEAERIVSDLLSLSRTRPVHKEQLPISTLVTEALTRQPPPETVTVTTHLNSNLPPVFIDPQQIGQVLTNLLSNAYQAMP
ncbi:MAG: PAS domain S-box protein, partial [Nitrospira sp.]|nr:PAS domain S-box protein [Nitrospira sp.]